jgi:hypothetical protein
MSVSSSDSDSVDLASIRPIHSRHISSDETIHEFNLQQPEPKRRRSKGGILSNLLKLKSVEMKSAEMKRQVARPTYQLKSIASSRAFLQSVGASPQSARTTLYFEDLHKAELGIIDDATVAAHRMEVAAEIADILQRQDLIIKLGKSLVRSGAPSHRIVNISANIT